MASKESDGLRVAILMGSQNDWDVMKPAAQALDRLGIPNEAMVLSAHRTPDRLTAYLRAAEERGALVFICGAGGAAHLAGAVAAHTLRPVLGVPIDSSPLGGLDALLATVQMPGGIPVGTLAVGKAGAKNAGLLAAQILAVADTGLRDRLAKLREEQAAAIPEAPLTTDD